MGHVLDTAQCTALRDVNMSTSASPIRKANRLPFEVDVLCALC